MADDGKKAEVELQRQGSAGLAKLKSPNDPLVAAQAMHTQRMQSDVVKRLKGARYPNVLDTGDEEIVVLRQYDAAFRELVVQGVRDLDDPWLCYVTAQYAFKGEKYVAEKMEQLNHILLQAALLLTICLVYVVDLPETMDKDGVMARLLTCTMTLATMSFVFVLLGGSFVHKVATRPFTAVDIFTAFMRYFGLFGAITTVNFVGVVAAVIAVIIATFDRKLADGSIVVATSVVFLVIIAVVGIHIGTSLYDVQFERVVRFKNQYLDADGQLNDATLAKLREFDDDAGDEAAAK